MPEWLDDNTIKGELNDEQFQLAVKKKMEERIALEEKEHQPGNYGNDGLVSVYQEEQQVNGIKYQLRVCRYFAVQRNPDGFEVQTGRGMNKIGKHVVVESNTRPDYGLRDFLGLDEFLWQDTLHSGQENWSLKQQWEYAESMAKNDILLIKGLPDAFDKRVRELQEQLVAWLDSLKK